VATSGGWVTDVLVVTTSVRVLDGVHGAATDLRPAVALDAVLVVAAASLKHRLVWTATTGNDTDSRTAGVLHPLLGSRWETDLGAGLLDIVSDESAVVARATGNDATVTRAHLQVGDDGTLRHRLYRQSVANDQLGFLAAVDELTGVHALHSGEQLLVEFVRACIVECSPHERSTSARIVNDLLHDALNEAITLAVVDSTELGGSLAIFVVRSENRSTALTLT